MLPSVLFIMKTRRKPGDLKLENGQRIWIKSSAKELWTHPSLKTVMSSSLRVEIL